MSLVKGGVQITEEGQRYLGAALGTQTFTKFFDRQSLQVGG